MIGPILLIIYIKNLSDIVSYSCKMYADHTKVHGQIRKTNALKYKQMQNHTFRKKTRNTFKALYNLRQDTKRIWIPWTSILEFNTEPQKWHKI